MDRMLQKTWWDHLVTTSNGKDPNAGVKLARRLKMYSNTSLRRLSVEQLDEALDIYKKYGNRGTEAYQSLNELKKQDGKTDIIVVADEILEARKAFPPTFFIVNSTDGGGSHWFVIVLEMDTCPSQGDHEL